MTNAKTAMSSRGDTRNLHDGGGGGGGGSDGASFFEPKKILELEIYTQNNT